MNVALIGIGNARWIAGVQYHHSLLYGNNLLPADRQNAMRVYLEEDVHRTTDYDAVRGLARGIHSTDFFPDRPRPLLRKLRKMAAIAVRQKRLPHFPDACLPKLLRRHETNVLFTANGLEAGVEIPQVCWIPDFQHWHHPEFFSEDECASRDRQFERILAGATRTIVSNRCGLDDVIRRYPEARDRIDRLPFTMFLGHGWSAGDPGPVVRAHDLPKKFLLFPSQFWKHKNHALLFDAVRIARAAGHDDLSLVCTGYPEDPREPAHAPSLRAFIAEHRLGNTIRILGLLPRDEQVQLMRAAAAVVQPSLYEGWSALIEDCRSLGKIVLASDIAMHREQRFEGMRSFDAGSAEALADSIGSLWPGLAPGPDRSREPVAEAEYEKRIAGFARHFGDICSRAVAG